MDILAAKQTKVIPTKLGDITVATPSLPKKLLIERKRAAYAGGFTVLSYLGADLAEMFATLDVVMTECSTLKRDEAANGWNYGDLYDEDALRDAYTKAKEWLDSFRNGVASEQTQVGQN